MQRFIIHYRIVKKHLPNLFTASNLFCGCLAIYQIAIGDLLNASILILIASLFDFLDGMIARLLKVGSAIGAQLDSLADMVSFGLVPSYLAVTLLLNTDLGIIAFAPFIMAVFSAFRLAKFNLDERQSDSFIGLPTPANALLWISIPIIHWQNQNLDSNALSLGMEEFLNNPYLILVLSLLMGLLMTTEIPLLALKFKNMKWKGNEYRYLLLLISIGLFLFIFAAAIPIILILYLTISLIENKRSVHHEV